MTGWRGRLGATLAAAVWLAACGANRADVPPANAEADQFLFDRGNEEFKEEHWLAAREYYRQIVDNYPQSPHRPDAKLGVGDTYIGEHNTESLLLAVNEFREFLTFYPTSPRADYAQFRLAFAQAEQMLAPERDQTNTREAVKELQVFVDRYPNSAAAARGPGPAAQGEGSAERGELPGRVLLLPREVVSGCGRPLQAGPRRGPGVLQPRRGLLPSGRSIA